MNLGIDFGSTYTIASTYRAEHQRLDAIEADDGSQNVTVPSTVMLNEKKNILKFGTVAKRTTGKKDTRNFKAFKMLLMEEKLNIVRSRGYDDTCSPQWAAGEFLKFIFNSSLKEANDDHIDHLVIGAPDVWFHSFSTLSGRAVLRDICGKMPGIHISDIQIISEPVLASAYFSYNYMKKTGKPFEGSILIIDYGGGTLDLSLAKVAKGVDKAMEIRMLESNGAGENTDHSIGNAGIVYMESLMEYVIRKNTPELVDELIGTPSFYSAVNDLEMLLLSETESIEITFEDNGIDDLDDLEDYELDDYVSCAGEDYSVTYADMVNVYDQVIRPVFEEKMNEMIGWARDEDGLDLTVSNGENFKIALVGGFSNFYLVKKQMREKFRFTSKDERERDIIENRSDRERAISYGAALIASGEAGVCSTAPYSIGVISHDQQKREYIDYMVHYRDEIEIDKPYYIKDSKGEYKVFSLLQNRLADFMIDYGRANAGRIPMSVKNEFQKRLTGIVKNKMKTCCLGISFGNSDVLSLHIKEFDMFKQAVLDDETVIELGLFKDVFEKKNQVLNDE